MHRRNLPPSAFSRFAAIGGVLDFAIFDDCSGSEMEIVQGIRECLAPRCSFHSDLLRKSGSRVIDRVTFFGHYLSADERELIKRGGWRTDDGRELIDPGFRELEGIRLAGWGYSSPEAREGGNFAHAFTNPPYSLGAGPAEVQQLFDSISAAILPTGANSEIRDWCALRLGEVSDYFEAGLEWWGVYLFSIHLPERRQLTIILGSTTD